MVGLLHRAWGDRRLARVAAWACTLAIAWASLSPRGAHLPQLRGADKIAHAAAYLVLAGAWAHALYLRAARPRRAALVALALAAAYGGAMEGLQHFVPHRTPELWDAVANAAGAAVGAPLAAWATRGRGLMSPGVTDR